MTVGEIILNLMAVRRRSTAIKLSNLSSGDGLITESREVPLSWIPRTSRGMTAKLRDDGRRGNALNLMAVRRRRGDEKPDSFKNNNLINYTVINF